MFSVTVADTDVPYNAPMNQVVTPAAGGLLCVGRICYKPVVLECAHGSEIVDRFSAAQLIEIRPHWNTPKLHGDKGGVIERNKTKRTFLGLGIKKGLGIRSFYCSAHFIAPFRTNGCEG